MDNPIIVALDNMTLEEAQAFVERTQAYVAAFKVNDLFFEHGMGLLSQLPGKLMVDLKLHDIPNTVANTLGKLKAYSEHKQSREALSSLEIVTVHASGGKDMIRAAADVLPGKIAAVTVLTSIDKVISHDVYGTDPLSKVKDLVRLAFAGGAEYIVCSGEEVEHLQHHKIKKIVPAVRPVWAMTEDDQRRTVTPAKAIRQGATYLVMGRPIRKAPDPVEALQKTLEEIEQG